MIVKQIWTANAYRNFNYLIACSETGEALAIDPLDSEKCLRAATDEGWKNQKNDTGDQQKSTSHHIPPFSTIASHQLRRETELTAEHKTKAVESCHREPRLVGGSLR